MPGSEVLSRDPSASHGGSAHLLGSARILAQPSQRVRSRPPRPLTPLLALLITAYSVPGAAQVVPHRSHETLVSSNGRVAVSFDAATQRVTSFLEHIYRFQSSGAQTRDFAYDSYPGIRVAGASQWLSEVVPSHVGYEAGTGIIHIRRELAGVGIDEYVFAPMGLDQHAYLDLVRVERLAATPASVDGFFLHNFHMGTGSPDPGSAGETIVWEAAQASFMEWGPSNAAIGYGGLPSSNRHAASPDNPFALVNAGADLTNNAGTGGTQDDAVAGLQWQLGSLNQGESAWFGSFVVVDSGADVLPRIQAVRGFVAGRSPEELLNAERAEWQAWHAVGRAPANLTSAEAELHRHSMAVLRMGQVTEPGRGNGQILASLPPGMWNIAWVRDMAYAVAALARSGHLEEARRALRFQLEAESGRYQAEVGFPYQISITRYFGDGVEETDENQFGPNIEFDGFGLFLWTLHEYLLAGGEPGFLQQHWPLVSSQVADTLLSLQEPSGLIAPDSSIWEVHWDGQQKRFAYTTLTAANGLCRAAHLADSIGDSERAAAYRAAGVRAQRALISELSAPSGALAQSLEELNSGSGYLDAAAIEAVGFGLLDPRGPTATATLASIKAELTPPSGRGFFRNDDGGWYDNQEWVFVDLRTAYAMRKMEDPARAPLLEWVTLQAAENYNLIAELHDEINGDYRGEIPMVGFGAGAYVLALLDREQPNDFVPCGAYAEAAGGAGGAGGTAGSGAEGGSSGVGGAGGTGGAGAAGGAAGTTGGGGRAAGSEDGGCGCKLAAPRGSAPGWVLAGGLMVILRRARRRAAAIGKRGPHTQRLGRAAKAALELRGLKPPANSGVL